VARPDPAQLSGIKAQTYNGMFKSIKHLRAPTPLQVAGAA